MARCEHCDDPDLCPGYGLCHCGCGEAPKYYANTQRPQKYVTGHWNRQFIKVPLEEIRELEERLREFEEDDICPYCGPRCPVGAGMCHCGCGKKALIARKNDYTNGIITGFPWYRLQGHHIRALTDEQVRMIRYLYATDETISQDELAKRFGVSQPTISKTLLYDLHIEAGIATSEDDTG